MSNETSEANGAFSLAEFPMSDDFSDLDFAGITEEASTDSSIAEKAELLEIVPSEPKGPLAPYVSSVSIYVFETDGTHAHKTQYVFVRKFRNEDGTFTWFVYNAPDKYPSGSTNNPTAENIREAANIPKESVVKTFKFSPFSNGFATIR